MYCGWCGSVRSSGDGPCGNCGQSNVPQNSAAQSTVPMPVTPPADDWEAPTFPVPSSEPQPLRVNLSKGGPARSSHVEPTVANPVSGPVPSFLGSSGPATPAATPNSSAVPTGPTHPTGPAHLASPGAPFAGPATQAAHTTPMVDAGPPARRNGPIIGLAVAGLAVVVSLAVVVGALAWSAAQDRTSQVAAAVTDSSTAESQPTPLDYTPPADNGYGNNENDGTASEWDDETQGSEELSRVAGSNLTVDLPSGGVSGEDLAAVQTLVQHGDLINTGDYSEAWSLLSRASQTRADSFSDWRSGIRTSEWQQLSINSVYVTGDSALVDTQLTTTQDAEYGNGNSCLDWSLTYYLVKSGSSWRIDKAKGDSVAC